MVKAEQMNSRTHTFVVDPGWTIDNFIQFINSQFGCFNPKKFKYDKKNRCWSYPESTVKIDGQKIIIKRFTIQSIETPNKKCCVVSYTLDIPRISITGIILTLIGLMAGVIPGIVLFIMFYQWDNMVYEKIAPLINKLDAFFSFCTGPG